MDFCSRSGLISTLGSIMEIMRLLEVQSTSTELSRFGVLQSIVWLNLTELKKVNLNCT